MPRSSLVALVIIFNAMPVHAGDDAVKRTITYVRKLQTSTGGFTSMAPPPTAPLVPTLRATSTSIRALHYLGSEIPDKQACIKFVESCWDAKAGAFTDTPAGKADIFTTAVGIMAVTELGLPTEKYAKPAIRYLSDNAKTFEDIRIAAAGLERLKATSPKNTDWLTAVKKIQNADGTFGKSPGQARATGGASVTLLRLGGKLDDVAGIIKTLNHGQRQNGGYGKDDDEIASDLETTYRVMRCYVMLKAKPAYVEGVRSFIAKCRNEDGGYGIAPGQPSSISGTYFATIVTHWLKQ